MGQTTGVVRLAQPRSRRRAGWVVVALLVLAAAWVRSGAEPALATDPPAAAAAALTATAAGDPTAPGTFVSLAPTRILDTRYDTGAPGPAAAGSDTTFQVTGEAGVPADGVSAVVLNVTVNAPSMGGFATVYPAGTTLPTASNLNFAAGQTVPNAVTVKLGAGGRVSIRNSAPGTAEFIADVAGYFIAGTPVDAGAFASLAPARILDTRGTTESPGSPVAANSSVTFPVTGTGGVPTGGVAAVVLNVTVYAPSQGGFATVHPAGTALPTASNLNFVARQTVPNAVTVKVGTGGAVSIRNSAPGTTHFIVDVAGYYLAGTPTEPGAFVSLAPARVLDTRYGTGDSGPVTAYKDAIFPVSARGGVPACGAIAAVLNVTVTGPTTSGFATAYPTGTIVPTASNLNFAARQTIPNAATVKLGAGGRISVRNSAGGNGSFIADVAGYYLAGRDAGGAGAVVSSCGAEPLTRAAVALAPTTSGSAVLYADTDAAGTYQVLGPTAGPHRLCVDDNDGLARADNTTADLGWLESCRSVTVTGSGDVWPGATLALAGALNGRVTTTAGLAVPGVAVSVRTASSRTTEVAYGYTESDGRYTVRSIPSGSYIVCFDSTFTSIPSAVKRFECHNNSSTTTNATAVTVTQGAMTTVHATF